MENNHIICIDLKSFFAPCECIRLNKESIFLPLIDANPSQRWWCILL